MNEKRPGETRLIETHRDILLDFAKKYIWWESPQEAIERPYRVLGLVDVQDPVPPLPKRDFSRKIASLTTLQLFRRLREK